MKKYVKRDHSIIKMMSFFLLSLLIIELCSLLYVLIRCARQTLFGTHKHFN